jgi:peptidyl-prolyl cis-trans isomerase C
MKKILLSSVFTLALTSFALAEDKVIATVNGEKIYQSELQRNINQIPNYDSLPTEQQVIIKEKIVQAITKLTAVVQEAKKLNIQDSTAYKQQLKDFKQQLMYSTLLEDHIRNVVTEAKLKEFYNKNKDSFVENKAKASHILLQTEAEANEVIQKLKAGGDFAELASEYSIGPSAKDGGNLGWFNKDTMVGEFSKAVFELEPGKYTQKPVKTQFGWHVILLEDKVVDTPSLYEDVKEQINQEVMQIEVENYLEKIINKAEIVIEDEDK